MNTEKQVLTWRLLLSVYPYEKVSGVGLSFFCYIRVLFQLWTWRSLQSAPSHFTVFWTDTSKDVVNNYFPEMHVHLPVDFLPFLDDMPDQSNFPWGSKLVKHCLSVISARPYCRLLIFTRGEKSGESLGQAKSDVRTAKMMVTNCKSISQQERAWYLVHTSPLFSNDHKPTSVAGSCRIPCRSPG